MRGGMKERERGRERESKIYEIAFCWEEKRGNKYSLLLNNCDNTSAKKTCNKGGIKAVQAKQIKT